MHYTVDRFEGDFAVIELGDGRHSDMQRVLLPPEAREGDVLKIVVDQIATKERSMRIGDLMLELFE